jgi:hypothetical protein
MQTLSRPRSFINVSTEKAASRSRHNQENHGGISCVISALICAATSALSKVERREVEAIWQRSRSVWRRSSSTNRVRNLEDLNAKRPPGYGTGAGEDSCDALQPRRRWIQARDLRRLLRVERTISLNGGYNGYSS